MEKRKYYVVRGDYRGSLEKDVLDARAAKGESYDQTVYILEYTPEELQIWLEGANMCTPYVDWAVKEPIDTQGVVIDLGTPDSVIRAPFTLQHNDPAVGDITCTGTIIDYGNRVIQIQYDAGPLSDQMARGTSPDIDEDVEYVLRRMFDKAKEAEGL